MSYHWPFLDHAKVISIREYAEWSVETLLRKPLLQQLSERRVVAFGKRKMFAKAIISKVDLPLGAGYAIFLGDHYNLKLSPPDACVSFAHELGHTFGFDLETLSPLPYTNPDEYIGDEYDAVINCIEELADTFAYIWMSYVEHRDQLEEFLEKHHDDKFVDLRTGLPS